MKHQAIYLTLLMSLFCLSCAEDSGGTGNMFFGQVDCNVDPSHPECPEGDPPGEFEDVVATECSNKFQVSGLTPTSGGAGTVATLTGEKFVNGMEILVANKVASISSIGPIAITFTVPDLSSQCGSTCLVNIIVTDSAGCGVEIIGAFAYDSGSGGEGEGEGGGGSGGGSDPHDLDNDGFQVLPGEDCVANPDRCDCDDKNGAVYPGALMPNGQPDEVNNIDWDCQPDKRRCDTDPGLLAYFKESGTHPLNYFCDSGIVWPMYGLDNYADDNQLTCIDAELKPAAAQTGYWADSLSSSYQITMERSVYVGSAVHGNVLASELSKNISDAKNYGGSGSDAQFACGMPMLGLSPGAYVQGFVSSEYQLSENGLLDGDVTGGFPPTTEHEDCFFFNKSDEFPSNDLNYVRVTKQGELTYQLEARMAIYWPLITYIPFSGFEVLDWLYLYTRESTCTFGD
jgi:hypothetical protein